jgi:hypothetical protein
MRSRLSRHLKHLTVTSIALISTAGVLVGTAGGTLGSSAACGCEAAASLSITPNPLVFTLQSPNEEPITLAAGGAAGDELEIVTVGAIVVTKGTAGWVQLKGASCETKVLIVGGAACAEKMKVVKFPGSGETWEAEYQIKWKSIIPPLAMLKAVTVEIKAKG